MGIVLNADRTPSDKGIREEWEKKSKDPGLAKIIQLLDVLEHGANFWDRVKVKLKITQRTGLDLGW